MFHPSTGLGFFFETEGVSFLKREREREENMQLRNMLALHMTWKKVT